MSERLDEAGLKAATEAEKEAWDLRKWAKASYHRDDVRLTKLLHAADTIERLAKASALPVDEGAVTGEMLYDAFWVRHGWTTRTAFAEQAHALVGMWNDIAADARAALSAHTDHSPPEGEG